MSYLVSIDGLSGSGKSTAIAGVQRELEARGFSVAMYHDRLGEPTAATVDAVQHTVSLSPLARLYFMLAVRRQVIDAAIMPSLSTTNVVITDRYYPSTIAYQAYGQGLKIAFVTELALQAAKGAIPDRIFYIDVPASTALHRMAKRGTALQVFDANEEGFHNRVRQGYLAQAHADSRTVIINGTVSPAAVVQSILKTILADLRQRSIQPQH